MCENYRDEISSILLDCGLNHFGFCPFSAVSESLIPLYSTKRLPAAPATIISFVFPLRRPEDVRRNVARYATVTDYHLVVEALLAPAVERLTARFPDHSFVPFCDVSPLPEVRTAAMAGLGVIGQHNLLITKEFGSWVALGELVTDLALPVMPRTIQPCKNCGACTARCPTGVLSGPFDRERCLAGVTQRKKQPDAAMEAALKQEKIAWGCDRCQEVCPMNRGTAFSNVALFYEDVHPVITADNYGTLKNRVFFWRGEAVFLRNLGIIEDGEEHTM